MWFAGREGVFGSCSLSQTAKETRTWIGHQKHDVNAMVLVEPPWKSGASNVWSCGDDGCIYVWSDLNFQLVDVLDIAQFTGTSVPLVSLSSVADQVFCGSAIGEIIIWDSQIRQMLQLIRGDSRTMVSCLFSELVESKLRLWCFFADGTFMAWSSSREREQEREKLK
eukprot:CAMPEP_0201503044 /NCGR_PEP_ID=MMETSP0151_2-20130828/84454_1 /ASSEMBLY_ACC=CAM_ASM_000257 /TAXON_ID=200890 /ORGANISM="Paramoeba atlantica, Strain 621/1 / CCAP 1560/9" /LENGTH=166 /DNA_ID=CAMNT_0047896673 /DNA_START=1202 /DNA_END=1702 /DNA_ORIENTATION=-